MAQWHNAIPEQFDTRSVAMCNKILTFWGNLVTFGSILFQNSPLYIGGIGNETSTDNELSRQWLVHTALDALEERLATTNANNTTANANAARTDLRDLYLGLLYSTDTHKM